MYSFLNRRNFSFVIIGLGGFLLGAIIIFLYFKSDFSDASENSEEDNWIFVMENEEGNDREEGIDSEMNVKSPPQTIMVDVKGEVMNPGLYELEEGQRVLKAIEAAGGVTMEANDVGLNYAQKCYDEMVIYVPSVEEEVSIPHTPSAHETNNKEKEKININIATDEELIQLPGIGPAKAEAIIKFREENGSFKSVDELTDVPGIGNKTLENFIDDIFVP